MGIENAFLRKLPDLIFIALGIISQVSLAKRFRLSKSFLRIVLAFYTAFCFVFLFELIKARPAFNSLFGYMSAFLTLYGWVCTFAAAVLYFRFKLPEPFSSERRNFLNTTAAALCVAPVAALTTGIITRKDFHIKEIDVKIPSLAKDLDGLRLLQLSDIHMSAFFSASDLRRVVDASNQLNAHLGFVTGDLITGPRDPLDDCFRELKRLKTFSGLWGCLGNHEKFAKVGGYATRIGRKQNLFFLRHESQTLTFGTSHINLIGVDHQFKDEGYLVGVDQLIKPDTFNLLLSHNPDVFPVAARQGFQLVLAGHTHGGQINVEVAHTNLNIVDLVTPYTKGLYQKPNCSLYVTSGLGTIGVPVRLGAPPEITLIRLCAS